MPTKGLVNIAMGSVLSIWHYYREEGKSLPSRDILIDASKHTDIDDLIIDTDKSTVYFKDSKLKLDVGAIAKGFVCNKIYQFITDNDLWQSAVISLGGNIITVGNKPDNTNFIIGFFRLIISLRLQLFVITVRLQMLIQQRYFV